ncbi:hypothetical protein [Sporosarcina jiandibaonis]|uniref:hypothetical protein n=1 Tax=Sporosarcina jiandibaonis TaxID=2715535 RepID=UPI0015524711|nr:hypothetical protein [Sporosarcina jiandibaonis]
MEIHRAVIEILFECSFLVFLADCKEPIEDKTPIMPRSIPEGAKIITKIEATNAIPKEAKENIILEL